MSIMINKNSFIPTAYHLKLFGILINVKIIWVATVDLQLLIENCSVCTYRKFEPEYRAQFIKTQETTFPHIF
jgi:hypothetical protein